MKKNAVRDFLFMFAAEGSILAEIAPAFGTRPG
jgi:hypothetical protein